MDSWSAKMTRAPLVPFYSYFIRNIDLTPTTWRLRATGRCREGEREWEERGEEKRRSKRRSEGREEGRDRE